MASTAPACTTTRTVPELERSLQRGIQDKTYGATQCIGSVGGGVFHRSAQGSPHAPPPSRRIDHDTLFDLGDLTMPLCTSLLAMVLTSRGRLDITAPVATVLPGLGEGGHFADITLDMLLDHSSGLPAHADLVAPIAEEDRHRHPKDKILGSPRAVPALQAAAAAVPLQAAPGTKTIVSDLGFLILGWAIERAAGKRLDALVAQEVYKPLELGGALRFLPLGARPAGGKPPLAAATQRCPWRDKVVAGEVLEAHAWACGGVAGHAGLFGTATGVWRLCQRLVECASGAHDFFHTGTLTRFWTRSRRHATTRTLGWDTPTVHNSSAGKRFSRTSIGQASSLGPAVWLDTTANVAGVMLCNAAHPSSGDKEALLRRTHGRIFDLIGAYAAEGPPLPESDEEWEALFNTLD